MKCLGCSGPLTGRQKKFCSKRCEKRATRPTAVSRSACGHCGGPMPVDAHPNRRTCSDSCRHQASRRRVDPMVGKRRQLWRRMLVLPFKQRVRILYRGVEYELRLRPWVDDRQRDPREPLHFDSLEDPFTFNLWSTWQRACHILRLREQHNPDEYMPPATQAAKDYHTRKETSLLNRADFELRLTAIEGALQMLLSQTTATAELLAEQFPARRPDILASVEELLADIEDERTIIPGETVELRLSLANPQRRRYTVLDTP